MKEKPQKRNRRQVKLHELSVEQLQKVVGGDDSTTYERGKNNSNNQARGF
jgi:hypothetical protein